jgi:hypothetical protein
MLLLLLLAVAAFAFATCFRSLLSLLSIEVLISLGKGSGRYTNGNFFLFPPTALRTMISNRGLPWCYCLLLGRWVLILGKERYGTLTEFLSPSAHPRRCDAIGKAPERRKP